MDKSIKQEKGILNLLRICTVLLAAVSFWATATGMAKYTFPEGWQAYAASLGIQGLLLGLNFSLPSFLRMSKGFFRKLLLLFLTLVVLFCSSWFSYLFIAKQAYGDSWGVESRLLSQAVYREELFSAEEYTEQYIEKLEQALADQIIVLYELALEVDKDNKINVSENLIWKDERTDYVDNSAAGDIMETAIEAMEVVTDGENSQKDRENTVSVLLGMQTSLQNEIDELRQQITEMGERVATAENNLRGAQSRLANASGDVDITPYQNAVETASQNYERQLSRLSELEQENEDYQNARRRISYYLTILGLAQEGVSGYYIGTDLREIQAELLTFSPDLEKLMQLSQKIFERLQSATDLNADTTDGLNYQKILTEMNNFIRNLGNYRDLKEYSSVFGKEIDQLAAGEILAIDIKAQTDDTEKQGEGDEQVDDIDEQGEEDGQADDIEEQGEGNGQAVDTNEQCKGDAWKSDWQEQFNLLKSEIGGLPVCTLVSEENDNGILESFDRAASAQRLDKVIRNYLTNHNAAQEGLIYLVSPYRGVAVFSLFLALLLDISAFVTGVVIDRVAGANREKSSVKEEDKQDNMAVEKKQDKDYGTVWNIIPGLNRYIYLTGDYMYLDGIMTYKIIENGEEAEIDYSDPNLKSGFYQWKDKIICDIEKSNLSFLGVSEEPKDGIYENCAIKCNEGLLILTEEQGNERKSTFLGNITPYVPVYHLSKDEYEVYPVKDVSDIFGKNIVVALNREGTQIIAIYVISG